MTSSNAKPTSDAKGPSHKVVFIGDTAVGKTSIISQCMYNTSIAQHQPTIGIDYFAKTIKVGNDPVRMQIWDTAGQEKFHAIILSYLRDSTVAVLVFSLTSVTSFEDLKKWHTVVDNVASPVLVIVGNKADLDSERVVSTEDGEKYAHSLKAQYIETSARTPINIDELFQLIAAIPIPAPAINSPNRGQPDVERIDVTALPDAKTGGCSC